MVFMVRLKVRLFPRSHSLKLQAPYSMGDRGSVQLRYAYSESSCTLDTLVSAGNARAVVSPLFALMLKLSELSVQILGSACRFGILAERRSPFPANDSWIAPTAIPRRQPH